MATDRFKRRTVLAAFAALCMAASGCALFLIGAGAAGGYAISRDSVKNVFDLPKSQVYDQSLAVAKESGLVKLEDPVHGLIKASIQDVNITITIKQLTQRTIELRVQGRNSFFMPKVDVAQEIYSRIVEKLH